MHRVATDTSTDFFARSFVEFSYTNTSSLSVSLALIGKVYDYVVISDFGGSYGIAPSNEIVTLAVGSSTSTLFSGPVTMWDTGRHGAFQPPYNASALLSPNIAPGETFDFTIEMRQSITSADALSYSGSDVHGGFILNATPVPETETLTMLSLGLVGIAAMRRRRQCSRFRRHRGARGESRALQEGAVQPGR